MQNKSFNVIVAKKIKDYTKIINVDSDKSISIRSFLIASISHKISKISNVLESDDIYSCINCLLKLGVKIKKTTNSTYLVYGKGLGSLCAKNNTPLNFGNSGTLARLLVGILSTTPNIKINLNGDSSLKKRNMAKLINLMNYFGASFHPKNKFTFPLTLTSSAIPLGIEYKAGVSAQLKSAVILAGLNSYGNTIIYEDKASRNHTENILLKNSKAIKISKDKRKKNVINISGKSYLNPIKLSIPGDPSSAAFIVALTLLNKNSSIIIKKVGLNPRRTGFYQLLIKNGAKISFKNIKKINNELIGDIYVKSSKLKPINASSKFYVSATDEYPIMFVIAALTSGVSSFEGIEDLANKESNRMIEMKKIFDQIGIKSKIYKNKMKIYGKKNINVLNKKISVPHLGDHRICMSAMILALVTGAKSNIKNFETVGTSSPSFLKIIKSLGGDFEIKKKS